MKTIILDAYNVIHRLPELSGKLKISLQEGRKALLNFMVDWKRSMGHKGNVYIVYDGQDGVFNPELSKAWGIKCIFTSSKEEADDRIISMIRRAPKASEIIVVSDDGKVVNGCKVYGAKTESAAFLRRKRKIKNSIIKSRSKGSLSNKTEREINKYYEGVLGLEQIK